MGRVLDTYEMKRWQSMLINVLSFGMERVEGDGEYMKLKVMGRCSCGCGERVFFSFISKLFQIRWFMDDGFWFIYVHLGKRYWRFSNAGYLSGKS